MSGPLARLHIFSPIPQDCIHAYIALPADHPTKIGLRTYAVGLLLSLGPALVPFIAKTLELAKTGKNIDRVRGRKVVVGLWRLLRQEFGSFGFAFAITTAAAGGSFLRNVFNGLDRPADLSPQNTGTEWGANRRDLDSASENTKPRPRCYWTLLSDIQRTFVANGLASAMAIVLLQSRAAPGGSQGTPELLSPLPIPTDICKRKGISPTLDLTLILFVRALDSIFHGRLQDKLLRKLKGNGCEATYRPTEAEVAMSRDSTQEKNRINKWTSTLDSLAFCICSARCDQTLPMVTLAHLPDLGLSGVSSIDRKRSSAPLFN
jgi:hypothetical protein